jgi:ferredoxin-NADP reductase
MSKRTREKKRKAQSLEQLAKPDEISISLGRLIPRDRNTHQYYVCGPDPMMDSVEAALTRLGVSLANIESERYNSVWCVVPSEGA